MEAQHAGAFARRDIWAWAFTVNFGNETFIPVFFVGIRVFLLYIFSEEGGYFID